MKFIVISKIKRTILLCPIGEGETGWNGYECESLDKCIQEFKDDHYFERTFVNANIYQVNEETSELEHVAEIFDINNINKKEL